MKEKYLVDVFYKKIYGPYTNKKKMERDRKLIQEVSDLCLDVASNVLIQDKTEMLSFKNFETSDISEIELLYVKLNQEGEMNNVNAF